MKTQQSIWRGELGWSESSDEDLAAQLVLVFGSRDQMERGEGLAELRNLYPKAQFLGSSTAGEIHDVAVYDDSMVATAVEFDDTRIVTKQISIDDYESSADGGRRLAEDLIGEDLVHVFVLSDGIQVNGSELVEGITELLPDHVTVTGGLSGDGERFERTFVLGEGDPRSGSVVAMGLYSSSLVVGYASLGGWDQFGPERLITKSEGNVLFELDGRSALDLYKDYLGEHADGLPGTGLLFPLALRASEEERPVVRTILGVNEENQSLTFAGDIPQGSLARLMKANFDRLVDGAAGAAREISIGDMSPGLAILISCVGRKMVLKQRVEEEVEAVQDVFGTDTALTGFYSYGEISPFSPNAKCELHDQTMTISAFFEHHGHG